MKSQFISFLNMFNSSYKNWHAAKYKALEHNDDKSDFSFNDEDEDKRFAPLKLQLSAYTRNDDKVKGAQCAY
jgi:hypothetical protein